MDKFKNLERVMCKELEKLDSEYANKNEFTDADAKKLDLLVHAWKSYLTAMAMFEANEEEEREGNSYARGRNIHNGQYMSREPDYGGYSGHWPPPYMPYSYMDDRSGRRYY